MSQAEVRTPRDGLAVDLQHGGGITPVFDDEDRVGGFLTRGPDDMRKRRVRRPAIVDSRTHVALVQDNGPMVPAEEVGAGSMPGVGVRSKGSDDGALRVDNGKRLVPRLEVDQLDARVCHFIEGRGSLGPHVCMALSLEIGERYAGLLDVIVRFGARLIDDI